jgi:hypothetical protein
MLGAIWLSKNNNPALVNNYVSFSKSVVCELENCIRPFGRSILAKNAVNDLSARYRNWWLTFGFRRSRAARQCEAGNQHS